MPDQEPPYVANNLEDVKSLLADMGPHENRVVKVPSNIMDSDGDVEWFTTLLSTSDYYVRALIPDLSVPCILRIEKIPRSIYL